MERLSNVERIEKIRKLSDHGKYEEALRLVRNMDVGKIRSLPDLSAVADVYEANGFYEEAYKILQRVYQKTKTRRILYQLTVLSVRRKNTAAAKRYYKEYLVAAPNGADQYVLRFLISRLEKRPLADQIDCLQRLKEHEYAEEWAYELAKLYNKAGLKEKCIRECNDIILWFGSGTVVEKAEKLKAACTGEKEKSRRLMKSPGLPEATGELPEIKAEDLGESPAAPEEIKSIQGPADAELAGTEPEEVCMVTGPVAAEPVAAGPAEIERKETEPEEICAVTESVDAEPAEVELKEIEPEEAEPEEVCAVTESEDWPEAEYKSWKETDVPPGGFQEAGWPEPEISEEAEMQVDAEEKDSGGSYDGIRESPDKSIPHEEPGTEPVPDKEIPDSDEAWKYQEEELAQFLREQTADLEGDWWNEEEPEQNSGDCPWREQNTDGTGGWLSRAWGPPDPGEPAWKMAFMEDELNRIAVEYLEEEDYILTEEAAVWMEEAAARIYAETEEEDRKIRMAETVRKITERADRRNMRRLSEIVKKSSYRESGLLFLQREDFEEGGW